MAAHYEQGWNLDMSQGCSSTMNRAVGIADRILWCTAHAEQMVSRLPPSWTATWRSPSSTSPSLLL